MHLLVVRHAIAEDPAEYARTHAEDAGRPLTPQGKKKMKRGARGLHALVPALDVLATSPLTRARQTAAILAAVYDGIEPVVLPALAPGQPVTALAEWLERERRHDTVAIVGHEPGLSRAVSWLIAGQERPLLEIRKGAACLLEVREAVGAGSATLLWALTPSLLRNLED